MNSDEYSLSLYLISWPVVQNLCKCFNYSLLCCISYLQMWTLSAIAGIRFILSLNYRLAMLLANDRTESHTQFTWRTKLRKWDKITHRILYALVIGTSLLIAWPFKKKSIVFVRLILIASGIGAVSAPRVTWQPTNAIAPNKVGHRFECCIDYTAHKWHSSFAATLQSIKFYVFHLHRLFIH